MTAPSNMSPDNPPVKSEFQAGDSAIVRSVDSYGFQGRDPHPPQDLVDETVIVLAPSVVIDAESGTEYFAGSSELHVPVVYGEGVWLTDVNQPIWVYDTICISGDHKGQHYEMLDAELEPVNLTLTAGETLEVLRRRRARAARERNALFNEQQAQAKAAGRALGPHEQG